ncbi:hypothetical protein [Dactylosporangium sp. NPDC048998]
MSPVRVVGTKRPLIILMASAVPVAAALVPMAANAAARDPAG